MPFPKNQILRQQHKIKMHDRKFRNNKKATINFINILWLSINTHNLRILMDIAKKAFSSFLSFRFAIIHPK